MCIVRGCCFDNRGLARCASRDRHRELRAPAGGTPRPSPASSRDHARRSCPARRSRRAQRSSPRRDRGRGHAGASRRARARGVSSSRRRPPLGSTGWVSIPVRAPTNSVEEPEDPGPRLDFDGGWDDAPARAAAAVGAVAVEVARDGHVLADRSAQRAIRLWVVARRRRRAARHARRPWPTERTASRTVVSRPASARSTG